MDEHEAGRDFGKMFDLDRSSLTKSMVTRMEECMRAADVARDDLKEVVAECVQAEFGPLDIAAMKKIAKLRLRDKRSDAKDQLQSLQKISRAVDFDLFDWAETRPVTNGSRLGRAGETEDQPGV